MPNAKERVWTVEDVWALPDDPHHRYEAVDGELLVSPSPRLSHQVAQQWIASALHAYVLAKRLGDVVPAPSDVVLDQTTIVQPDVYVLPFVDGRRAGDDPKPPPMSAIEISSPSTARYDRLVKRPRYQRAGMECWIVDLDAQLVERWMPDAERPEILSTEVHWTPAGAREPFRLDVTALMAHVHGPV